MKTKDTQADRPPLDEAPVGTFVKIETAFRLEKLAAVMNKEISQLLAEILEQEVSWVELDSEDYAKIAREMKAKEGKKG